MLSNDQKKVINIYKNAAELQEKEYRNILQRSSGRLSLRDPGWTDQDFDMLMPILEQILDDKIIEGYIPVPTSKKIKNLNYWRNRVPSAGTINSRQIKYIFTLFNKLKIYLPEEKQTSAYLTGIMQHACKTNARLVKELNTKEASMLIDALKDRLKYAERNLDNEQYNYPSQTGSSTDSDTGQTLSEVPF